MLDARSQEAEAERLALWVEVTGARDGAYTYDIYFQAAADAGAGDRSAEDDGLAVVVPESSVARLVGARLDWSDEGEGGLVIVNPNTPPPAPGRRRPSRRATCRATWPSGCWPSSRNR